MKDGAESGSGSGGSKLSERDGFLSAYAEVTSTFPVRADLVPDAHLATILRQHDVRTIYTNDADFKKFDFLRVVNPLVATS